ncbi:MAG: DUF3800 domain-containing protein [Heliobacteriaceae bacterium]|jgi:hypothetical protein|nr:DUF3800 domain-containing protein [Heliobacteriaceae bacterium]
MAEEINIYCDESCHLENDNQKVMVLGAILCPCTEKKKVFNRIREIKEKHGLKKDFEIKWTKVSPAKVNFYLDLIDYFFDNASLSFRGLLVPNKAKLRHEEFNRKHNDFYYIMYYTMLKILFIPKFKYNIYVDIKDTRGIEKINELTHFLSVKLAHQYSIKSCPINRIQEVRSHQVELIQLADLIIGAISYYNRGLSSNNAKVKIVERLTKRGYPLDCSTLLGEQKFNLFKWRSREELP